MEAGGAQEVVASCAGVQTVGGRVQVRWESASAATPMGQLAYFIEFLTLTGLWSRWQESYPLAYVSPNAPSKAAVLGTWMLSILSGHRRYAQVTAIRCDGVNPGLLGRDKVISEDALRRALAATPEAEGIVWLDRHLDDSVARLLDAPWMLDIDTTVKPLYGKQEGAVVSYNPKKPGRPAHSYHTTSWRGCGWSWAPSSAPPPRLRMPDAGAGRPWLSPEEPHARGALHTGRENIRGIAVYRDEFNSHLAPHGVAIYSAPILPPCRPQVRQPPRCRVLLEVNGDHGAGATMVIPGS
jgi:hypothetical protein